ncbi:MAG: transporter substrate-binding domain-containing protein [Gammaproteobacteria bacterium]|nr:transporter substrate-binding domain-containing protein [Gammaproteobacteria bacterium]
MMPVLRRFQGLFGVPLRAILLSLLSLSATAQSAPERISIAYCGDCVPFQFTDEGGRPAGMIIDLWRLWERNTGIVIDFHAANWNETLKRVGDGRDAVHAGLFHTDARDRYLDFGDVLARTDTHVFLHQSLPSIVNLNDLSAYRIGVLQGDYVEDFLKSHIPPDAVVGYADYGAIVTDLKRGHLRAFAADTPTGVHYLKHAGLLDEFRLDQTQRLYSNEWRVAVTEGRSDLRSIIADGMAHITDDDRLAIERRWVDLSDVAGDDTALIISLARDDLPFGKMTDQGTAVGLYADYWRLWAKKTGTRIRFAFRDWQDSVDAVRDGIADVHAGIYKDDLYADGLEFAEPYYQVSAALYRRAGDQRLDEPEELAGKRIGVPAPLDPQQLKRFHPTLEFIAFPHYTQAIAALKANEIQAMAGEEPSMDYFLNREGLRGEVVSSRIRLSTRPLYPAVKQGNKALLKKLRAGMNAISLDELAEIEARWVVDPQTHNFKRQAAAHYDFLKTLSDSERAWLAAHPRIRLGSDIAWAPFEWVDKGRLEGLGGQYFQTLSKLTGLAFEAPPVLSWAEMLDRAKAQQIDVVTLLQKTSEREAYLSFTQPYLSIPQVMVRHVDSRWTTPISELPADVKIGVVNGYAIEEVLRSRGFGDRLVRFTNLDDGLTALTRKEIEVFVGNLASINHAIRIRGLSQVEVVGDVGFNLDLAIGVRNDWPELVGILDKALAAITPQERDALYYRAGLLSSDIRDFRGRIGDKEESGTSWPAFLIAAGVLFLTLVLLFLWLRRSDPVKLFGSGRIRVLAGVVVAMLLILVALIAAVGLMVVEQRIRVAEGDAIDTVLGTTQSSYQAWLEGWRFRASVLVGDPQLRRQVEQLLKVPADVSALASNPAQARIRELFEHYAGRVGDMGFFLISPTEITIGSDSDADLGTRNLIAASAGERLDRAFFGETVLVPPLMTEQGKSGDPARSITTRAAMFIITPLRNDRDEVIAVLALGINPYKDFSSLAQAGRVGMSGESYLVNDAGALITASRFEGDLTRLGLVPAGYSSVLNVLVRDPGRSLEAMTLNPFENVAEFPLTQAVSQLLKRRSGRDVEGYRDYRGVLVLGAWTWDEALGVGLITEIDGSEVLSTYRLFRNIVLAVVGTTVFLTLMLTGLTYFFGRAAHRSLTESKQELESRVTARTAELQEREQRMWDMYDNAPTPYASIAPGDGAFQKHNKAFAGLLQRERAEFAHLRWVDLVPDAEGPDVLGEVGGGVALMDRELRVRRADEERLHVLLSAIPVRNDGDAVDEIRLTLIDVTERKAAEKRFAALMESAPDAMVVINRGGELVLVNSQVEKVFGWSRQELLGNKIEMLLPESIRKAHVGFREKFFDEPHTRPMGAGLELTAVRRGGAEFPVEVSLSPIHTDEELLVVAVARDITERRAAEERLARSNRDLATLTLVNEAVMQALTEEQLLHDVCRILVEANDKRFAWIGYEQRDADKRIRQMARYGYEKGFLAGVPYSWAQNKAHQGPTGRAIRSAHHELVADVANDPDYVLWRDAAVDRDYGSVLAVPLSHHGDAFGAITIYAEDAHGFDEDTIQSLQRVADNVAHGVQALRSDQCRLETENERQEAEERSRLLLESVDEGIFGLDDDGRVSFVNPAGARMLGWEPDELIGRRMHALTHHSRPNGLRYPIEECPMHDTYVSGTAHHVDDEVLWRKDGSSFAVEYHSLPMRKAGRLVGAVITYRDVSALKRLAEELRVAKEQADAANAAKGSFLANMSHEIRTPMNAIIGLSHLALGTELNRKQQDYLTKIYGSAQNLLGIINDILDFSKIEAGKLDMESVDFDLQQELDNIASIVGIKAGEKSLEFLVDHPLDLPMSLSGDPLRLSQVIINLANNSVKFTDEGSVTVRIRLVEEDEDGYRMRFEVIDTGIGMTDEQRGRLFKAFSQADASTTRKYGGTGLGLTISQRLVEMMDGEIGVDSVPGEGSTFWFTARFGRAGKDLHRRLVVDQDFAGLRTLIVDDNAISREILTRMAESFGFAVTEVASGAEALEELRTAQREKTPYRLMLLDWKMPGMTGIELAARVREEPTVLGKPQMIMISAYGREELFQQAELLQLSGYLVKPVNASMLFDTVMHAFGRQVESGPRTSLGMTPQAPDGIRGAHLLLVEDNDINQEVATEILQQAGFKVSVAGNGKIALDMLDAAPTAYDGVLMDMHMPVMDGLEATRQLRAQERFANLPILAMTAAALAEEKARCFEAGMNAHIAKPIDVHELVETLTEWVNPSHRLGTDVGEGKSGETPVGDALPVIPGLNTEIGLTHTGGNVGLYQRILGKFQNGQADVCARIRRALSDGDQETATREAHTLKGVAGNIGATEIVPLAALLEKQLKQGGRDVEVGLRDLEKALARIVEGLRGGIQNAADNSAMGDAPETLDLTQVINALADLRLRLEQDDADAADELEALQRQLAGVSVGGARERLVAAVSSYDFETALSALDELESLVSALSEKPLS